MFDSLKAKLAGNRTEPEPAAPSPDRRALMMARLESAEAAVRAAEADYGLASLEAEQSPGRETAQRRAEASRQLDEARQRATELRSALAALQRKEAEEAAQAAQADLAQRWAKIRRLAPQRAAIAAEIDAHAAGLVNAGRKLSAIHAEIHEACAPRGRAAITIDLDTAATMVRDDMVEMLMRLTLLRNGARWALASPLIEAAKTNSAADRMAAANAEVERIAAKRGQS